MKKILSGMLYRLFRGFEIWALLLLLLFSSYILFNRMYSNDVVNGNAVSIELAGVNKAFSGREEVREYCYSNIGIRASDIYKYRNAPLESEVYDRIENSFVLDEKEVLINLLEYLDIFPVLLTAIFIPVFFGRVFSDGTIKNLISCGHSRAKIYAASLFLSMIINTLMLIVNLFMIFIYCLFFQWLPPVWIPVILPLLLLDLFFLYVVSAVSIAVLFTFKKMPPSIVAGFLMFILLLYPVDALPMSLVTYSYESNQESVTEFISYIEENGANTVDYEFDLSEFTITLKCGEMILGDSESDMDPAIKKAFLTAIYLSPTSTIHCLQYCMSGNEYILTRGGLVTVNIATDILWLVISTAAGYLIFRKRELN